MLEDLIAIIQRPLFGRRSNSFPGPGCEFQPGIYKTALPFGGGSVNVVNGGEGWVIPYVTQHTNAHQDMNTRGRLILWYQMFLGFFRDIRMLKHMA